MLERYADAGRMQAASLVAFGVVVPPGLPLGLAAAALVTLRRGPVDGVGVVAIGLGLVAALVFVTGGGLGGFGLVAVALAVTVGLADLLRRTGSLSLALQGGILVALVVLLAMLLAIGDQVAFWSGFFEQALDQMIAQGANISPQQREGLLSQLPFHVFSAVLVGVMTLLIWVGLFVGRSWQARLVNPGGFGQEFRELRFGRTLALGSGAVFFATALIGADWLLNVAALVMQLWVIQGLAYLHWVVARGEESKRSLWLLLSYGLLGFFWLTGNALAILVPLAGIVGETIDFRARLLARGGGGADR